MRPSAAQRTDAPQIIFVIPYYSFVKNISFNCYNSSFVGQITPLSAKNVKRLFQYDSSGTFSFLTITNRMDTDAHRTEMLNILLMMAMA